jgi:hypothetical protein
MWNMWQDEHLKALGDVASVGLVIGALVNYLPIAAAIVSLLWASIRLAETETVQMLLGKFRWISKKETRNDD